MAELTTVQKLELEADKDIHLCAIVNRSKTTIDHRINLTLHHNPKKGYILKVDNISGMTNSNLTAIATEVDRICGLTEVNYNKLVETLRTAE